MTQQDHPKRRRRLFGWAGPTLMLVSFGAMLYSTVFAWIDPHVEGVLVSGLAFAALFVASFWVYAFGGFVTGVLLSAVHRRRYLLGLGMVGCGVLGAPMLWNALPVVEPEPVPDGRMLTVMSANLLYGNGNSVDLLRLIDEVDPDVLVLQEYTDEFADRCESVLQQRFPHAVTTTSGDAFGQATFSRFEFAESPRFYPQTRIKPSLGWPPQTEVVVRVGERDISVVNVHLLPPTGFTMVADQHRMASGLAEAFGRGNRPTVLAGDFNSNERGLPVRRVLREGYRSVHTVAGHGLGATWPRIGVLRHLPGTRLDHVLYRGESLVLIEQGVGDDFGSDHRPVWATFRIIP